MSWRLLEKWHSSSVTSELHCVMPTLCSLRQLIFMVQYQTLSIPSRKILYQCLYSYIMEKYRFTTYHEKFYKQVTTTTTMTPVQWLLFQNNLGKPVPERKNQSGFKWGKRWWGSGMQWHQLDHMQTICTSLQTDNHTNTLSLNFYRPDALPDAQPTVQKHCAALTHIPILWTLASILSQASAKLSSTTDFAAALQIWH